MRRWKGLRLLYYLPSLRHGSQGTSNNRKWTMPGTPKSWWPPKQFVYCCAFNHPFAQNILFLTKVIFIQGAFKNIQGLLCKIQGLVKRCQGYPTIFQFSRTFQGHHAFSMTFQGPCEPWLRSGLIKQRPSSNVQLTVLYISLSSVHDYNMKMPNATFCGERKEAYTIFSFSF